MNTVVKDSARAVTRLDENALLDAGDVVSIDGQSWMLEDLLGAVARNVGGQYVRVVGGLGAARGIKKSDVTGMLIGLGASSLTVDRHSARIASMIRKDYTL